MSEINSEVRALNKNLRETEERLFASIVDLPGFLALNVQRDLSTLEASIAELLNRLETERRLALDLDAARSRPEPAICSVPQRVSDLIARVEGALAATFDEAHRDAESRLREHLENHTEDPRRGRSWIQQGKALMRGDECPFCGQKVRGAAVDLIAAYQTVFNDAFDNYVRETLATLDVAQREFTNASCVGIPICIEQNQRVFLQYPELRSRPDLRDHFQRADEASVEVIRQCVA